MMPQFTGLPLSKSSFKQITLAYYLCRKTLNGSPGAIKRALNSAYFDDIRPDDLLPLLKPCSSKYASCATEYRGFRQLAVIFVETKLEFGNSSSASKSFSSIPTGSMGNAMGIMNSIVQNTFVFDVHYCMRKHTIARTYEDCYNIKNVIIFFINS